MDAPSPSPPLWPRLRAWLELLRLPNLFTLPGDVLAGMALVSLGSALPAPSRIAAAVACSLALYALGLILNDITDVTEDRVERPHRPLPSGRISSRAALGAGLGAAFLAWASALGAGRAPAMVAGGLMVVILGYTYGRRWLPGHLPALVMGVCRAGNLALGAAFARPEWDFMVPTPLALAMGGSLLYITAVTLLARHETGGPAALSAPARYAPAAAMATATGLILAGLGPRMDMASFAGLTAVGACVTAAAAMECRRTRSGPLPMLVGRLVHLIVPWQAFLLLASGHHVPALVVLVLWYGARILSIRFAAS